MSSATLASANGTRGSISRRVTVKYGDTAPATPNPNIDSDANHGTALHAAYLPSSASGGARSTDELADEMMVITMNKVSLPVGATNGNSRNATHETPVVVATIFDNQPTTFDTRSAICPISQSITAKIT